MKKRISFNKSCIQQRLETFTSASAFPHASLQSLLSPDEVKSRKIADLEKPRLLRKIDKTFTQLV